MLSLTLQCGKIFDTGYAHIDHVQTTDDVIYQSETGRFGGRAQWLNLREVSQWFYWRHLEKGKSFAVAYRSTTYIII